MKSTGLLAIAAALAATGASATDFSYTGTFLHGNDKASFNFAVGTASLVTLESLSYAGGTNAQGQTIAAGGFDPILSIYDSTGTRIATQDDGRPVADPTTGRSYDTLFSQSLAAGNYTVFVTQYDNFGPMNINDPFPYDNDPNFRPTFIDNSGHARDGHWAFDILNVDTATQVGGVPEASTWAMMIVGFGAVGGAMRRTRAKLQLA